MAIENTIGLTEGGQLDMFEDGAAPRRRQKPVKTVRRAGNGWPPPPAGEGWRAINPDGPSASPRKGGCVECGATAPKGGFVCASQGPMCGPCYGTWDRKRLKRLQEGRN